MLSSRNPLISSDFIYEFILLSGFRTFNLWETSRSFLSFPCQIMSKFLHVHIDTTDLTAILNDCLRVPFDATQQSLLFELSSSECPWRLFPMTRKLVLPTLLVVFSGRSGFCLCFGSLIVMDPFGYLIWVELLMNLHPGRPFVPCIAGLG